MTTKLFLRNTTINGIVDTGDGFCYDMRLDAGAAETTAVVNTTATGLQFTKTAGGATVAWISARVPVGGFTLTSVDMSAWYDESNAGANVGERYNIYKYSPVGPTITLLGTFDAPNVVGSEFTTSPTERLMTCNVPDTAFLEDERILIRAYIINIVIAGAIGTTRQATMHFNAANAATGDSFATLAETVVFKGEIVTGAGAAAGAGVGTGVGRAIKSTAGSATGAGAASGVGRGVVAAAGAAAGVGAAPGVATRVFEGSNNFATVVFDRIVNNWGAGAASIYPNTLSAVGIAGYVAKLREDTSLAVRSMVRFTSKVPHPTIYKLEGWFKSSNRQIDMGIWDLGSNWTVNSINLTTGAELYPSGTAGTGFTPLYWATEAADDGFWHVTLIAESNSAEQIAVYLDMYTLTLAAYTGDGVSGLFFKDVTLEEYNAAEAGWVGAATLEFVGTDPFIEMIQSGEEKIGYSAQILLRSL